MRIWEKLTCVLYSMVPNDLYIIYILYTKYSDGQNEQNRVEIYPSVRKPADPVGTDAPYIYITTHRDTASSYLYIWFFNRLFKITRRENKHIPIPFMLKKKTHYSIASFRYNIIYFYVLKTYQMCVCTYA